MNAGGSFSLQGTTTFNLRQKLKFILLEFHMPYNVYVVTESHTYVICIEIYEKPQILLLKELNGIIKNLEQKIDNIFPYMYKYKIIYKDIKDKPLYI